MTKKDRRWRNRVIAALASTIATLLIGPASAQAACPFTTGQCFAGVTTKNSAGSVNTASDGVYARITTIYGMNVAWSNGDVAVQKPAAAAYDPDGFNGRGLQIGAYSGKSFVQVGYTAGCGQPSDYPNADMNGCTGLTDSFGVYKRLFVDGVFCQDANCPYFYQPYNPVSGDQVYTFQIQRNLLAQGPSWRFYANGVLLETLGSYFAFGNSKAVVERPSRQFTGGIDRPLDMTGTWSGLQWHRNGAASANPPGTANYQTSTSLNPFNQFTSGCSYSVPGNQTVGVSGTC